RSNKLLAHMKRFIHIFLTCFGLMTFICIASICIGHAQGEVTFIPELDRCGDELCYLGIIPSKTAWDSGIAAIRQDPRLRVSDISDSLFHSSDPPYIVGFLAFKDDGADTHSWVFGEINLHLDVTKSTISTGNVLAKFGEPCFVSSS